jgi:[ribosomal protein S5]-alanine N-acetyltransferase
MQKIELTSGDVKIRTFKKSDCNRMAEIANNDKIFSNLRDGLPHPYTVQHAKEFIATSLEMHPQTIFAIEYKGEYAGNIGLHKGTDVYRKSAEVGYFLGEEFWNKGIVTIALNLICDYGFQNLDIVRIHAGIYEHNIASQRVLEKCGFVREGVLINAVFKQEKFLNEVRFAKLKYL